jgi:perosamine synthetase
MIPHSKLALDETDIASVTGVLRSGMVAQGEVVSSLEESTASFVGTRYGVAVNSGTAALHLSLLSLGIGEGSEVIIPSYVCTALLNAIHYVRATSVFVDIDPDTYNITAQGIQKALTDRTGAIIVPHMFGLPADMDAIVSLGIPVIEDCAHAVGATFRGRTVGSFGALSILSFYATKMLGAGEGGMVLCNDGNLRETIRDLRGYDEKDTYKVRYNYKMPDIQAALCKSQLQKLPSFIEKRKEIANIYTSSLESAEVKTPALPENRDHIYYRYVITLENAPGFIEGMKQRGIECRRPVFKPLHRYMHLSGYPMTEKTWKEAVSIPIYPSLTKQETHLIVDALEAVL